jgi:hypothetical protein
MVPQLALIEADAFILGDEKEKGCSMWQIRFAIN